MSVDARDVKAYIKILNEVLKMIKAHQAYWDDQTPNMFEQATVNGHKDCLESIEKGIEMNIKGFKLMLKKAI